MRNVLGNLWSKAKSKAEALTHEEGRGEAAAKVRGQSFRFSALSLIINTSFVLSFNSINHALNTSVDWHSFAIPLQDEFHCRISVLLFWFLVMQAPSLLASLTSSILILPGDGH